MPRLTDKQRIFTAEYVRSGFDRKQAALKAGYSERSWESLACNLLQKPQIKAEIDRHLSKLEQGTEVKAEEIIQALRKIAFAPESQRVTNGDRIRALELLGRTKALYSDKLVSETAEYEPKIYTDEERAAYQEAATIVKLRLARGIEEIA